MLTRGQRIKSCREALGWSQAKLGKEAGGVRQQTIDGLEKDASKKTGYLMAIAEALSVNPKWLETGEGPQKADPSKTLPLETAYGIDEELFLQSVEDIVTVVLEEGYPVDPEEIAAASLEHFKQTMDARRVAEEGSRISYGGNIVAIASRKASS